MVLGFLLLTGRLQRQARMPVDAILQATKWHVNLQTHINIYNHLIYEHAYADSTTA